MNTFTALAVALVKLVAIWHFWRFLRTLRERGAVALQGIVK